MTLYVLFKFNTLNDKRQAKIIIAYRTFAAIHLDSHGNPAIPSLWLKTDVPCSDCWFKFMTNNSAPVRVSSKILDPQEDNCLLISPVRNVLTPKH